MAKTDWSFSCAHRESADIVREPSWRYAEAAKQIRRRIVEWREAPVSPPVYARLADKDEMVARWQRLKTHA